MNDRTSNDSLYYFPKAWGMDASGHKTAPLLTDAACLSRFSACLFPLNPQTILQQGIFHQKWDFGDGLITGNRVQLAAAARRLCGAAGTRERSVGEKGVRVKRAAARLHFSQSGQEHGFTDIITHTRISSKKARISLYFGCSIERK